MQEGPHTSEDYRRVADGATLACRFEDQLPMLEPAREGLLAQLEWS